MRMLVGMYRRGYVLVWGGFGFSILVSLVSYIVIGYDPVVQVPWGTVHVSVLAWFLSVAAIISGCVLVLRAKRRNIGWLLLLLLSVIGVAIIFALKDMSVTQELPNSRSPASRMAAKEDATVN